MKKQRHSLGNIAPDGLYLRLLVFFCYYLIMARGSQDGVSNNPNGRPVGTKNKFTYEVKNKVLEYVTGDFIEKMFAEIDQIDNLSARVRAKAEIIKLFIPRPVSEEEQKSTGEYLEYIRKLCGC